MGSRNDGGSKGSRAAPVGGEFTTAHMVNMVADVTHGMGRPSLKTAVITNRAGILDSHIEGMGSKIAEGWVRVGRFADSRPDIRELMIRNAEKVGMRD